MTTGVAQRYFRPVPAGAGRQGLRHQGGGRLSYSEVEVLSRDGQAEIVPVDAAEMLYPEAAAVLARIEATRTPPLGLSADHPLVMGVVNVTPDSFSDGGQFGGQAEAGIAHALALAEAGADILDIGGESTRPGAEPVPEAEELARVIPVIEGIRAAGCTVPISIDTRNAAVARAALAAGARLLNDVSALTHDPDSMAVAKSADAICLMHALGDPRTMQDDPKYGHVLLDVYDYLAGRVAEAEAAGIPRTRLIVDPGIGFGKTVAHNLALIRGLALFHGLGCTILLGVSRKGFIGRLSGETRADRRAPGAIAAGLAGLDAGVQILRVHDVAETVQAIRVWQALREENA